MNYFIEFDLYIDIVLTAYIFWAKIFSLSWCEKIVKKEDAYEGTANKPIITMIYFIV